LNFEKAPSVSRRKLLYIHFGTYLSLQFDSFVLDSIEMEAEIEGEQQAGVECLFFFSTANEIGCFCVGLDNLGLIRTDDHVAS